MKQAFDEQAHGRAINRPLVGRLFYSKSMRLLTSHDFQVVFDKAPLRTSHQHFLFLARHNQLSTARLGLVIAKKHIRLSVQRNRLKRLIRETFRAKQQQLTGLDVIVLARKGMDKVTNPALIEQLNAQWQRLMSRVEKNVPRDPEPCA